MNTLGNKLRTQRELLKLSMGDLAEKSGLSKGYINNLEKGRIEAPGDDVLKKLAAALELPLTDLLLFNIADRLEPANEGDESFQQYLKARFGIEFTLLSQGADATEPWKGEYSRDGALTAHAAGSLSLLVFQDGRLCRLIDPHLEKGEVGFSFPPDIVEGARSLVQIRDDSLSSFGYRAGEALFIRPVHDREQVIGKRVIALQGQRHIIGIFRRDDIGEYLEAAPGGSAPWRNLLEPGTEIEAEVLASIRRD